MNNGKIVVLISEKNKTDILGPNTNKSDTKHVSECHKTGSDFMLSGFY